VGNMITIGKWYVASNQGFNITPQSIRVCVVWTDGNDLWYRIEGSSSIRQTTHERFRCIV